jgi:NADH-quinone oxidoreductase subunit N
VGKLAMFMHALNTGERERSALMWLVALGFFNSVVSAFYYTRILKALFLRPAASAARRAVPKGIVWGIVAPAVVVLGFGVSPRTLLEPMESAALAMLRPGLLTAPANENPETEQAESEARADEVASQRPSR